MNMASTIRCKLSVLKCHFNKEIKYNVIFIKCYFNKEIKYDNLINRKIIEANNCSELIVKICLLIIVSIIAN